MSHYSLVFIKNDYFLDHPDLKEILKSDKMDESNRVHLFLNIRYKENNIFIPLRSNIDPMPKFGLIGFAVPSKARPNAGLDYRKILIINDLDYIEFPDYMKIPVSQQKLINQGISTIEAQSIDYIKGYEKSFKKGRTLKDNKYKYSSLCNFHKELGLE